MRRYKSVRAGGIISPSHPSLLLTSVSSTAHGPANKCNLLGLKGSKAGGQNAVQRRLGPNTGASVNPLELLLLALEIVWEGNICNREWEQQVWCHPSKKAKVVVTNSE